MKRKKSSSELAILFPKWNGSRELYIPCRVHSTCRISTIWFDTLTRLYIVHLTRFYFDKQIVVWGREGWMTFRCSFIFYCTNDDVLANLKVFRIRKPGWKEYEDKQGSIKITVRWECTHISFLKACPIFFCWTAQKEKSSEIKQKI